MKKRSMVLATVLIWCGVGIILIATALFFVFRGFPGLNFGGETVLLMEEHIDASNIGGIKMDCTSQDIIISPSPDNQLHATVYGNENRRDDVEMRMDGNTWTLVCRPSYGFLFFNWGGQMRVELQIPQAIQPFVQIEASSADISLDGDWLWQNTDIRVSSGNVHVTGTIQSSQSINVQCTSGNIRMNSLIANDAVTLSGSSGDIEAQSVQGVQAALKMTSGRIEAGSMNVQSYDINITSGEIDVDALSGGGSVGCTSGNISCSLTGDIKSSRFKCTSGNIDVRVPEGFVFNYNTDSASGDIKGSALEREDNLDRGSDVTLDMQTTSGNISVDYYTPIAVE